MQKNKDFVLNNNFSMNAIESFAKKQGVKSYIVIGRLQSDKKIGWDQYNEKIVLYEWAE